MAGCPIFISFLVENDAATIESNAVLMGRTTTAVGGVHGGVCSVVVVWSNVLAIGYFDDGMHTNEFTNTKITYKFHKIEALRGSKSSIVCWFRSAGMVSFSQYTTTPF